MGMFSRRSGGGFISRALSAAVNAMRPPAAAPAQSRSFETREQNRRTANAGAVQALFPSEDETDMLGRPKKKGAARTLLG